VQERHRDFRGCEFAQCPTCSSAQLRDVGRCSGNDGLLRLYCSRRAAASISGNANWNCSLGSMNARSSLKKIDGVSDEDLAGLMKTAQAGDTEAYTQLLQEVTVRLRRIVRRYRSFLTDEDIEDLVQEILLSLHSVRATYDPQRPFMPWLLAITR